MAGRRLFTVTTPLGDRVFLTRDRWRQIVKSKHPAVSGQEGEVRRCLESPALIRSSATEPAVHLDYAPSGPAFLCVVTAPADADERFVVTASFTKSPKKGNERWTS